jgi:S-adenosylmethionine:tRNA ribosyltransferase-isomerase
VLAVSALEYVLPPDRIATEPVHPRDSARLLILRRSAPSFLSHRVVSDLPQLLSPGDLLVVNTSAVVPARLVGTRVDTGGRVEGLYLGEAPPSDAPADRNPALPLWRVLLKGRRLRPGVFVGLTDLSGNPLGASLKIVAHSTEEGEAAAWVVEVFSCVEGPRGAVPGSAGHGLAILQKVGSTPLPPYIRAARKRGAAAGQAMTPADQSGPSDPTAAPTAEAPAAADLQREQQDRRDYQTVYADPTAAGSVAAPTAGLHFTPELLARLESMGVARAPVVLHVGTGTFKPVETEYVEQHPMHTEWCVCPAATARAIAQTRAAGGRVIAVGTTSARTLESFSPEQLAHAAASGQDAQHATNLLITPGHRYRNLDGMMTNFHLPRSTLLAMVAALLDERSGGGAGDGLGRLLEAYRVALQERYRFYSYGDASLILP